ncbi:MAG TPA: Rieske 2Fe-2S domain-containing protein [Gemmataceae bacterium]|jgi:Rieske Fe-S protein|nr:Rieske 2Fe-2S domain-containing protein [Gemmataceae bacterium]
MHANHSPPPPNRRSLLKWATHGLGALFGALLGIPAIAYVIDARNRPAPDSDFRTVARLSELHKGVPHQVVIRDVRRDAWTLHPSDVIGRVWLVRGEGDTVNAFTTICPHLGCSVNFEAKDDLFLCPCHGGTFLLDGQRKELTERTNPAPRGMDRLEIRLSHEPDPVIAVKYQNFLQGKETPIAKT